MSVLFIICAAISAIIALYFVLRIAADCIAYKKNRRQMLEIDRLMNALYKGDKK